jgi:putative ABC transport system ATP-binding protein
MQITGGSVGVNAKPFLFLFCDPMIQLKNIKKIYNQGKKNEVTALNNIDLDIKQGEFLSISGPSGSGKSTLLNIIGTLDRPTEGDIRIDGKDVSLLKDKELSDFRRNNIGFIFQLYNLIPVLSAFENVKLPLLPYRGNIDKEAKNLLEKVGLKERLTHLPSELSGGEQQKVAIARALINDPEILLADEPTGNIDTKAGNEIIELLKKLNKERKMTVIIASHNLDIVRKTERVVELRDGVIQ